MLWIRLIRGDGCYAVQDRGSAGCGTKKRDCELIRGGKLSFRPESVGIDSAKGIILPINTVTLDRAQIAGPDRKLKPACPGPVNLHTDMRLYPGARGRGCVPGSDQAIDRSCGLMNG